MTLPLTIAHNCLILDACCIINLYASDRMADVLTSISQQVAVATYVRDHEARAVYAADGTGRQEPIDLSPYISQGLLLAVDLETPAETLSYVDFTAVLGDDGESMTGAIASERNWAIGTDDIAAIKFFQKRCPHLDIVSSLQLVKYWAESTSVSPVEIGQALRLVRVRGRYQPRTQHALYSWWQSHYNG